MEQNNATANVNEVASKKPKLMPTMEILESAINVWWKNLAKFAKIYLWGLIYALIPLALMLVIAIFSIWRGEELSASSRFSFIIISIVSILFIIYFSIRAYAGIFLLVKNNYKGKELELFKEAKKFVFPYIGLTILTTIFIILWTLLLIIPGIIFSVFYSFAVYAFFFEDKRGLAAIRRSKQLVRGYFWAVFGRFIVLGLVIWLFTMIISTPLFMVPEKSMFWEIWNGVVQLISIITGPVVLLFSYQIYQDLVKIKK